MKNWIIMSMIYTAVWILMVLPLNVISQAIQISSDHPQYWSYQGEPVLLLGGSVEDNLFQIPNLEEHLDLLSAVGGNYVRNTMSSRDPGDLWPFHFDEKSELYDLDKWNQAYCRADAGNSYAVYFPAGGSVALDLSDCRQSGEIQWLNVMETTWFNSSVIEPGDKVIIEAPGVGQFVALIEFD